jgi:hypothetical protein
MFEWTDRLQASGDWITFILFMIFALLAFLSQRHYSQFRLFVDIRNLNNYLNIYGKDKYLSNLHEFNLILFFISLLTYALYAHFFYQKILISYLGRILFHEILIFLFSFVVIRYFVLKMILNPIGLKKKLDQVCFESITIRGLTGIMGSCFLLLYHFTFPDNYNFLFISLLIVFTSSLIYHITIYIEITRKKPMHLFYIILYLCGFKIAPWLWLYSILD